MAKEFLRGPDGSVMVDMFGLPMVTRGRGQPEHEATPENRQKVTLALIDKKSDEEIAAMLGISAPTLRKHYFSQLAQRASAKLLLRMKALGALAAQADSKPSAAAALLKWLDKLDQREMAAQYASPAPPARGKPQGKKAEAKVKAGQVVGRFAPPDAPLLTKH